MKSVMKEYSGYIHKGYLHFYGANEDRNPETDLRLPLDVQDYWIKECEGIDCIFRLKNGRAQIIFKFYSIR